MIRIISLLNKTVSILFVVVFFMGTVNLQIPLLDKHPAKSERDLNTSGYDLSTVTSEENGYIAGKIFVDENYNGIYDAGDIKVEYKDVDGKGVFDYAFIDNNGNGICDLDDIRIEDDIDISVDARETALEEKDEIIHTAKCAAWNENAYHNTYEITGLKEAEYIVRVTKAPIPIQVADLQENTLRFERTSRNPFIVDLDSSDRVAEASFEVGTDGQMVEENQTRDIALEYPRKIKLVVEYEDCIPEEDLQGLFREETLYEWNGELVADNFRILELVDEIGWTLPDTMIWVDEDGKEVDSPLWTASATNWTAGLNEEEIWETRMGLTIEDIYLTPVEADIVFTAKAKSKRRLTYDGNVVTGTVENVPVDGQLYVDGETVILNDFDSDQEERITHSDIISEDGTEVIPVLFYGWTRDDKAAKSKIYGVNDKNGFMPELVDRVTFDGENVTVYAVWVEDRNRNHIPDCDDQTFTLQYDANGGDGSGLPNDTEYLFDVPIVLEEAENLTKTVKEDDTEITGVFIGWSKNQWEEIIPSNVSIKGIQRKYNLISSPYIYSYSEYEKNKKTEGEAANVRTLYAVYAEDRNKNDTSEEPEKSDAPDISSTSEETEKSDTSDISSTSEETERSDTSDISSTSEEPEKSDTSNAPSTSEGSDTSCEPDSTEDTGTSEDTNRTEDANGSRKPDNIDTETNSDVIKSGDDMNMGLCILVMILSFAIALITYIIRKKDTFKAEK